MRGKQKLIVKSVGPIHTQIVMVNLDNPINRDTLTRRSVRTAGRQCGTSNLSGGVVPQRAETSLSGLTKRPGQIIGRSNRPASAKGANRTCHIGKNAMWEVH